MDKSRILGLDIGSKRTGVAISDDQRRIALPHSLIETSNKKIWLEKIRQITSEEDVGALVIGLPLNHHGEEGQDAKKIREFIALLQGELSIPVIEWDERFTTVQAERSLISADVSRKKRKETIDKVAATIILQSYLDSLRFHHGEEE